MSTIKLKMLLDQHGIKQTALAAHLGISKTALSHLLNQNKWLAKRDPDSIKQQVEAFLIESGITSTADIWQPVTDTLEDDTMEKMILTQAARKLFSLFRDPFSDDVTCAEDVFISADQRYIRETIFMAAKHGGFIAVIGESGAGKSVLRRDLIDRIQRDDEHITIISPVMPDKLKLTAATIEDAIIYDLDSAARPKRSQEAKARQMQKLLVNSSRAGNAHCLVIEEAHDLSLPTLKQLKRFWELEDGFKRLLSIVLIGQPELKNKLNERINWEAREVIRRCEIAELMPLDDQIGAYITHKLTRIGADPTKVFADDAIAAIRERLTHRSTQRNGAVISQSYPLAVNNLTTRVLNHAADIGATRISADIVRSA